MDVVGIHDRHANIKEETSVQQYNVRLQETVISQLLIPNSNTL